MSHLTALFINYRTKIGRKNSEMCYELDKADSNKQYTSSFSVIVHHKNESQGTDILFWRELLASIAQANENLTRNVLKTILTANKVKEQICMHEVQSSACNAK